MPSSASVIAASTTSHESMSARSPETISASCPSVRPRKSRRIGSTGSHEAELVSGDLADIDACDVVLAAFTEADEGTAMEAWYARASGTPVVAYTGGRPAHPWAVYVSAGVYAGLEDAVAAVARL